MRYLDPKNDLTFKKIFGEHPHLLKSFLNGVLPIEDEIEELEYLPAEQVPELPLFKNSIVDVRCRDVRGRQFIVEMQMLWTDSFKRRVLFNASKAYVRQLERGKKYRILQPVYALSIVNEIFAPESPLYYHHYKVVHLQDPDDHIEGLELIFIELPKFEADTLALKRAGVLWLRFLKEIEDQTEKVASELTDKAEIQEALGYLQESAFSREQLEYYDRYWDAVSRERSFVDDAWQKGMAAGQEQGLEQGLERGLEQGLEQGRQQERIRRITRALQRGKLTLEEIAEDFEVPLPQVVQIQRALDENADPPTPPTDESENGD